MPTLEDVLERVMMANEHIVCGLADDARWMLELVEGDLSELMPSVDQGHRSPTESP
jgi:hypothetical protein